MSKYFKLMYTNRGNQAERPSTLVGVHCMNGTIVNILRDAFDKIFRNGYFNSFRVRIFTLRPLSHTHTPCWIAVLLHLLVDTEPNQAGMVSPQCVICRLHAGFPESEL